MINPGRFLTGCRTVASGGAARVLACAIAWGISARRVFARPALLTAVVVIGAALAVPSSAMQGDTIADRVLGQVDFVHIGLNLIDAGGMLNPQSVAIDSSVSPNRLYVADSANSRVLGYRNVTTFVSGGAADLVLGQSDFLSGACNKNATTSPSSLCNPIGVAVDASGNLYVGDSGNSRVLEYHTPFAGCGSFPCVGGSASTVFGQGGSFTTNTCDGAGVSKTSLCMPVGVAVDGSGNLYVADSSDNRVLEYTNPLSNSTADLVFGQGGSFSANTANNGGVTASSLSAPDGVAVDASGDLFVADNGNNRVLEYTIPLTNGTTAEQVFGQGGVFNSGGCNNGGLSASSLCGPVGVAVDGGGNLYVADDSNNRVLEYSAPLTTTANTVFGQTALPRTDATWARPNRRRAACAVRREWRWTAATTCTSPSSGTIASSSTSLRSQPIRSPTLYWVNSTSCTAVRT